MKNIILFLIILHQFRLYCQNFDLTGEWKGFAYQTDGTGWYFTANFTQSGDSITGGIYYTDDKNPNIFVIYKMKGKIFQNRLQYIEYEILKDNPRAFTFWCYIETFLDINIQGDSIFLTTKKAESWTKNQNGSKEIKCPDAFIKFSKKYEPKTTKNIQIQENIKVGEKITVYAIQFQPSRADLLPKSIPALEEIVNYLKSHPSVKLEIIGHTDKGKNPEYNLELSLKRAEAVKDYFVKRGINSNRLSTKGKGSKEPIADNNTPQGRAKNRRTEFKFLEVN